MPAISLIFSRATSGAIIVNYPLISLLIAVLSCLISFHKGSFSSLFRRGSSPQFDFTLQNYVNSILISYSFDSLASLLTDILLLPLASFSMYMGRKGVEDGIFLVGVYSALSAMLVASLIRFFVSEK